MPASLGPGSKQTFNHIAFNGQESQRENKPVLITEGPEGKSQLRSVQCELHLDSQKWTQGWELTVEMHLWSSATTSVHLN